MRLTSTRMGFRSLSPHVWPIYAPWMAASLGMSILLVALPIWLLSGGHGYVVTSVVAGAGGAGAAGGALIVGRLVDRSGPARVACGSLLLMILASATMAILGDVVALGLGHLAFGVGSIGVMLSRQADLTRRVPVWLRGRAMSMMGGSMRLSVLVGTACGGVLVDVVGGRWTIATAGLGAAIGLPAVIPTVRRPEREVAPRGVGGPGLGSVVRTHRRPLMAVGVFGALAMAAREGRMVLLPLVGVGLGLRPSAVGVLVAAGYAADLLLFPVSGYVMDRLGRLAAMVPAYGLLAIGLLLLSAADSPTAVLVAGLVMGVGNGLSSGSLFTLGSDVAPEEGTASFLAAISLLTDSGRIVGPLLVGVVAGAGGLGPAAVALAVVMAAGVTWLLLVVGETSDRAMDAGADHRGPRFRPVMRATTPDQGA